MLNTMLILQFTAVLSMVGSANGKVSFNNQQSANARAVSGS